MIIVRLTKKNTDFHGAFAFYFLFDTWLSSQPRFIPFTVYQSHIHLM